jgi:hypothetical protein
MVIPVVLFFAVMQRHFMESVTQSGIK